MNIQDSHVRVAFMIDMLKLNALSNVGSGCSEEQVGMICFGYL